MKPYLLLLMLGGALAAVAAAIGGRAAGIGGLVAVAAQGGAVALLRPAMDAPQARFFARWAGGMALRALANPNRHLTFASASTCVRSRERRSKPW